MNNNCPFWSQDRGNRTMGEAHAGSEVADINSPHLRVFQSKWHGQKQKNSIILGEG